MKYERTSSRNSQPSGIDRHVGPPGVGKTHLVVGLGIKAVEQSFSVQYFRFDELLVCCSGW